MHDIGRILVVEEDAHVRFFLSHALSSLGDGYEVLAMKSGAQALAAVAETDLDLLVSDVSPPGIERIHLTGAMRKEQPNLPVIWITSSAGAQIQEAAIDLRIDLLVEKPVEMVLLRETARELLNSESENVC